MLLIDHRVIVSDGLAQPNGPDVGDDAGLSLGVEGGVRRPIEINATPNANPLAAAGGLVAPLLSLQE